MYKLRSVSHLLWGKCSSVRSRRKGEGQLKIGEENRGRGEVRGTDTEGEIEFTSEILQVFVVNLCVLLFV